MNMKKLGIIDLIKIDEYSATPKYLQIVNSVKREIEHGNIQIGDNMPSINELSIELDIARDTVERGYKRLKSIGIIDAVPRRGYFIKNIEFLQTLKIFLFFNKLSAHKKTIYDSFVASLGENALIDFYIYNNDFLLFKKLLSNKKDDYTHYVIIPHFIESSANAYEIINAIPKEKLLLLDKLVPGVTGEYAAAYENFEKDIYDGLTEAIDQLSKYHTLKIIFPEHSYYPPEILIGLKNFCQDNAFSYKVISAIAEETINEGEVYIAVMEDDLVTLIERTMLSDFKIGEQVGIISYNETPLKKVILNGITTISTNFHQMGLIAAELILANSKEHVEVPFKLTLRASL
ncbi:GntR family transcriptional regulator [Hydrotalea sp.]|uniref:GntR family transcriptional regulator n=2 Tax=Hydrotalea sp. TaxID=2881279 RepID=UPI00261E07D8|nr:GntR family transcriptional regulator [Hydrotalea sp.]